MAQWKSKGYVADSDEEEDSQDLDLIQPASQHENESITDGGVEEISEGQRGTDITLKTGQSSGSAVLRTEQAVKVVIPVTSFGTSNSLEVQKASGQAQLPEPELFDKDAGNKRLWGKIQEEIDELQEDHYKEGGHSTEGHDHVEGLRKDDCEATPTARLQAELDAQVTLSDSRPYLEEDKIEYETVLSSPLSSPDSVVSSDLPTAVSLIEAGPAVQQNSPRRFQEQTVKSQSKPQELLVTGKVDLADGLGDEQLPRKQRNLRHRNPIQLHPYAIEAQKHKRTLNESGIKALRFAQLEGSQHSQDESQNGEYTEEESQDAETQEILQPSSPNVPESPPSDLFGVGGDDFPDVNVLLRRSSAIYTSQGYKRRRKNNANFKRPSAFSDQVQQPSVLQSLTTEQLGENDDTFNIPLSPPSSGNTTPIGSKANMLPRFQMPRQSPLHTLPTPITSSEPRRGPIYNLSDDHSSSEPEENTQDDDVEEVSDKANKDDKGQHLQRVQRKIRGVLPASWLKLDIEKQTAKPRASVKDHWKLPSMSPEKIGIQRGVARPVPRSNGRTTSGSVLGLDLVPLSDDDETIPIQDTPSIPPASGRGRGLWSDDDVDADADTETWGEALENDHVDAMLPTGRKYSQRTSKQRKRQTKIADFGLTKRRNITAERCSKDRTDSVFASGKSVQTYQSVKHTPKFRPPKLSILDASNMNTSTTKSLPRFVKLASRTARLRHDKGQHSPSRKFLRLATREDTNDTAQTLRDWRSGRIPSHASGRITKPSSRLPLYPRSANILAAPERLPPTAAQSSGKSRPIDFSRKGRTNSHRQKHPKTQLSLDALIQRKSTFSPTRDGDERDRAVNSNTRSKRGQLVSFLQASNGSRPAMLESLATHQDRMRPAIAFQRDLKRIDNINQASRSEAPGDHDQFAAQIDEDQRLSGAKQTIERLSPKVRKRQLRKRQPRQLDVSTPWSRDSTSPDFIDDVATQEFKKSTDHFTAGFVLTGLGPFGTRYSCTFDITPLPIGTCFHASTLLGSGIFHRSLKLLSCDLDNQRGYSLVPTESATYRWGPWGDTVSSEIATTFEFVASAVRSLAEGNQGLTTPVAMERALALLKHAIQYISDHLSFFDSVDRVTCIQRFQTSIAMLQLELDEQDGLNSDRHIKDGRALSNDFKMQVATSNLILANQIYQISMHQLVPPALRDECKNLTLSSTRKVLADVGTRLEEFHACLSRLSHPLNDVLSIDLPSVQGLVVAQHIIRQGIISRMSLWDILQDRFLGSAANFASDVGVMEPVWRQIYYIIPFLELDSQGALEVGSRFTVALDGWPLAKRLISPVLEMYVKNPRGQASTFNAYCRALFGRCLHLIDSWGWRRSDPIIGLLFDFFAANSLGHLRNEESHGSPSFLSQLDTDPVMSAEPQDRCFHLFLKIVGTGLKHMRHLYPDKKIRDIIWRLMPNHGRLHPKDEAIRQEDLDALRNHHDLICTLYWASPQPHRPKLSSIRNLVHVENSHREACHINIRAWSNLVKYQISVEEPISSLEPFRDWHDDLLRQILGQHALARTEAEGQVKSLQHIGGLAVSQDHLETIIATNQRQIVAILSDAVVSLKLAIDAAKSQDSAAILLSPAFALVFNLFDLKRPQANAVITQALDVVLAYADKCLQINAAVSGLRNDDSQDYGDWAGFEDAASDTEPTALSSRPLQSIQEPLRHLMSNCFGADLAPQDSLLLKMVQAWTATGQMFVQDGVKSWNEYIGRFGNDSWASMRDTEQTRKFTAYYMALLIRKDQSIYEDNKSLFLTCWIGSFVERQSLLKFQHELTSDLLNVDSEGTLFVNLPFSRRTISGRFEISASEFSERRLSLISSVLSNMRTSLELSLVESDNTTVSERKQEYKDLLKHLMTTMKRNYQELGQGSNISGAYVDFIHRVVECLQQYTSNICPVDRFFTDNAAFPLPATDPTYVVGQLKNYSLRLQDSRAPKQLAVFLQSVSERAAIDGQQDYLVDQLSTAMSNTFEEDPSKPTLRAFIIGAIVPAYVELAFETSCGWILALPFLQASRRVFRELRNDLDGFNAGIVTSVISMLEVFLNCVGRPIVSLLDRTDSLDEAAALKVVTLCYKSVTALLPTLDYVVRLDGPVKAALQSLQILDWCSTNLLSRLDGQHQQQPNLDSDSRLNKTAFAEVGTFAIKELRDTLQKHWRRSNDAYTVTRGASRKEVVVNIGLVEEEREELVASLHEFHEVLDAMTGLGSALGKEEFSERKSLVGYTESLLF